jgi:hypothetical protein
MAGGDADMPQHPPGPDTGVVGACAVRTWLIMSDA